MNLIIPEPFRARHWVGWETAMKTGVTRYDEGQLLAVPALHKDGRGLSIEFSIPMAPEPMTTARTRSKSQFIKDADGQTKWVVAVIRDMTERYRREKALQAQLKASEHDDPTPITKKRDVLR
jgi:nitric oxide dioxygenase